MSAPNDLPADLLEPPEHLTPRSKEFFRHVVGLSDYDAPARALLIRFCEVRDELEELRRQKIPAFFQDKHGQPRVHPGKKHELALTNEYGKLFRLLGWDQAPPNGQGNLFD